jgi:MYXO-CTERM domain-containing protein
VLAPPAGDWRTGTWTWTLFPPAADNDVVPARNPNGTYSRFRYVPSVNAFVLVSSTSGPVWMIRVSDKPGTGTNPGSGGAAGAGGGSTGSSAAASGAGGAQGAAPDSGEGCGCRLAERDGGARLALLAILGGIIALHRRRRARA